MEFVSSTLFVDVGCCRSQGRSLDPRSSTTLLSSTSSTPSQTNSSQTSTASTGGSLPVAALVAITIGAALLVFGATFLVFFLRRWAIKRQKKARMYSYPKGYRTVAPDTPPTRSPSPSTLSSLSRQALLDLGFNFEDDNELYVRPNRPFQTQATKRRSVDTIFALRFYYSQEEYELDRPPTSPFIAELPATPLLRPAPVPSPRSTPSPPPLSITIENPAIPPAPERAPPLAPKRTRARRHGGIYLNPAGEPWVSVPPPRIPLPPTPPVPPPSSSRSPPTRAHPPRFSLFPPPVKPQPNAVAAATRRQNPTQSPNLNHQRRQSQAKRPQKQQNYSRPAPIKIPRKPVPPSLSPPRASPTANLNSTPTFASNPQLQNDRDHVHIASPPASAPPASCFVSIPLSNPNQSPNPNSPGSGSGSDSSRSGSRAGSRTGSRFREVLLRTPTSPASAGRIHFPPPPGQRATGGRRSLPGRLWAMGWGGRRSPNGMNGPGRG